MLRKITDYLLLEKPSPLYVEHPVKGLVPVRLDDVEYGRALQSFVLVCTDALIINRKNASVFLALRKARPMKDQWWFIGGRRLFGEPPLVGMIRCFHRETGLKLPLPRFRFLSQPEYLFADRQQEPHDAGTHSLVQTFSVELTEEERAKVVLDQKEYHESTLREFSFDELTDSRIQQSVRDMYELAYK